MQSLVSAARLTMHDAFLAAGLVLTFAPWQPAVAKTPGATYCHNDICHRVRSLHETAASIGIVERVLASFYDDPAVDPMSPNLKTSSGEKFDPASLMTVASPVLPNGTIIAIRNPANGHSAIARVTDSGPYYGVRLLDLSRGLAETLDTRKLGIADLEIVVVHAPSADEATFKSARRYERVPGPVGTHATLVSAMAAYWVAKAQKQSVSKITTASIPKTLRDSWKASTKLTPAIPSKESAPITPTAPQKPLTTPATSTDNFSDTFLAKNFSADRF